ncbi:hypothetical protein QTO30_14050 [Yoonia sp. GPGPB17]|uniref:hypothetical protein n=1 Tax=Yoonia sp. GPGPB17 TaxID=3026147 RepID=UPI0030BE3B8B
MTRFIAFAALGIIRSNAKLILISSIPSVLLTLAAIVVVKSLRGYPGFVFAEFYTTGVPQFFLQAIVMSLFATRFLRLYLLQEAAPIGFATYMKMVGGYIARVLGLGFVVIVLWTIVITASVMIIESQPLNNTQMLYLPLLITLLASTFCGWLWLRFALVLPAYVVGQPMTWRAAWRASRVYKYHAILWSVVYYLAYWFILIFVAVYLERRLFVEPALTTLLIWAFAVLKVTTLAAMYDRALVDQQSEMSSAFD